MVVAKPQEGPWLSGGLNVERLSFPNSFYQLLQVGLGNFSGNWIACLSWLRLAQSSSHFHPECMKGTARYPQGWARSGCVQHGGWGGGKAGGKHLVCSLTHPLPSPLCLRQQISKSMDRCRFL